MARTTEDMVAIIASLPSSVQEDIKSFMEDNPNAYIYEKRDIVKAYLEWNGIIGYEEGIIQVVRGVYR